MYLEKKSSHLDGDAVNRGYFELVYSPDLLLLLLLSILFILLLLLLLPLL